MSIGPYAEMSIITQKSDVEETATDNTVAGVARVIIALLLFGPAVCILFFMGLFICAHIGPIAPAAIIGLAIWACGHYGTNNSILDRFRYRTTPAQRAERLADARVSRRLSDSKKG